MSEQADSNPRESREDRRLGHSICWTETPREEALRHGEEEQIRLGRVAIYEARIQKHGSLGDDFAAVLAGTAAAPEKPLPKPCGAHGDDICVKCGRRCHPKNGESFCWQCRQVARGLTGAPLPTCYVCGKRKNQKSVCWQELETGWICRQCGITKERRREEAA